MSKLWIPENLALANHAWHPVDGYPTPANGGGIKFYLRGGADRATSILQGVDFVDGAGNSFYPLDADV